MSGFQTLGEMDPLNVMEAQIKFILQIEKGTHVLKDARAVK